MAGKFELFLLLILPIIAAFDYVVAHRLIDDAKISGDPRIYEQFYYIVIATGIVHLIWLFNFVLAFQDPFRDVRFWRILTMFVIFQTILIYGLAVWMTLFLQAQLYLRDSGVITEDTDYYITWSAVSMACLWFDFIVFILIIIRHIYHHEDIAAVKLDEPSRV